MQTFSLDVYLGYSNDIHHIFHLLADSPPVALGWSNAIADTWGPGKIKQSCSPILHFCTLIVYGLYLGTLCDSNGSAVPPGTPLDASIVSEAHRWIRPEDESAGPSRLDRKQKEKLKGLKRAVARSFKQALLRMMGPPETGNNNNTD